MSTNKMLESLKAILETDEGKERMKNFSDKLRKEYLFNERWENKTIDFLKDKTDAELSTLFEKFNKHEDKRRNILYSQHIDGQTSLFYPLFKAFEKLGGSAPEQAYGMFSSAIFDYKGYRVELYCGQGCFYAIGKI